MAKVKDAPLMSVEDLKRLAQELLERDPESLAQLSPEQLGEQLQAVQEYQNELEQKNAELLEMTKQIEKSHPHHSLPQLEMSLENFLAQSEYGFASLDLQGNLVEANQKFADLFGYSMEEVRKLHVSDLHPPESEALAKAMATFENMTQQGRVHFQNEFITKSGEIRIGDISAILVEYDGKKEIHAIFLDIHEREKAEEVLQKSEEKFLILTENLNAGVVIHAPDTSILHCNQKATELLKLSMDQMLGKVAIDPTWKFVREDGSDMPVAEYPVNLVIDSLKPLNDYVVGTIGSESKQVTWVLVNAYPESDLAGELLDVIVTFVDITDRKQAEEKLRRREAQFRSVVETSQDWIWSIDLQGVHTYSNPAVKDILGFEPEELVGKPSLDLMHEDDKKSIEAEMPHWIAAKKGWQNLLIRWKHKEGEWRQLESSAVPIIDTNGEIVGFRGVDRDITGRKQAEEALQELSSTFSSLTTTDLLNNVCQHISEKLDVVIVFVGRLDLASNCVEVIGGCAHGEPMQAIEYELADTPCENVYGKSQCSYITGVQDLFPKDHMLVEMGIDSYLGAPLFNAVGVPIGIFVVLDSKPLVNLERMEKLFKIFESRITVELERKAREEALEESELRIRKIIEQSNDAIYIYRDDDVDVINNKYTKLFGLTIEDIKKPNFNYNKYVAPESRQFISERERNIQDGKQVPSEYEYSIISSSGKKKVVEASETRIEIRGSTVTFGVIRDITTRRSAERVTRENEFKQRALISNISDVIAIIDKNGINRYVSPNVEKWYGWQPDELVGLDTWQNIHPEDLKHVQNAFVDLLSEPNSTTTLECRYKCKNSSYKWSKFTATNFLHDSVIAGVLLNYHDIEDRKRMEAALQTSEERFRTLMHQSPLVIEIYDVNGLQIEVNKAYEELWGFAADTTVNKFNVLQSQEVVDTGLIEYVNLAYQGVAVTVPEYSFDSTGDTEAKGLGRTRWLSTKIYPLKDPTGYVKNIVITHDDITKRKEIEHALQEAENIKSLVLNSTSERYTYYDLNLNVQWANYAAEKCISDEKISLNEYKCYEEWYSKDKVCERCPVLLARDTKRPHESTITTTEGLVWHVRGYPVLDEQGEVVGMSEFSEEITEKIRQEEQRLSLEKQLQQSQKLESIGLLAGGVSHDLNNLLTPILVYSELLRNRLTTPELITYSESIEKAGDSAKELVHQLLAFSRKQSLKVKSTHLNELVRKFDRLLQRTLREDIKIKLDLDAPQDIILADENQIEQVVMNLSVNAQDAMPDGGTLSILTGLDELKEDNERPGLELSAGRYVFMSVHDNGIGMSSETVDEVFEPFFTTKEVGKGTGLGLSTVFGIVKQHGGDISVESQLGHGTTFTLFFPIASARKTADEEKKVAEIDATVARGTLLIAEDDEQIRRVVMTILQNTGYNVLYPESPDEALEIARQENTKIDLLITDVVMPGLSGRELFDQMLPDQPGLKVMFMSGYTDDVISGKGILKTNLNFLGKPFTRAQLLEKIQQALLNIGE
jgi:two-component system, cell cycle sensor histidine kinase and response regulator CckA